MKSIFKHLIFGFFDTLLKARLLRATFYILTKQQDLAMEDLTTLIGGSSFKKLHNSFVCKCNC